MTLPYRMRPGSGFVALAATVLGCVTFFVWGLQTPPLDEVWRLQLELKVGDAKQLSAAQFALLQQTLQRYPDLADHMLEGADSGLISLHQDHVVDRGYAYLVRKTADSDSLFVVSSQTHEPLRLDVVTIDDHASLTVPAGQPLTRTLPSTGPFPQLVGIHLDPPISGDAAVPTMRVELRRSR